MFLTSKCAHTLQQERKTIILTSQNYIDLFLRVLAYPTCVPSLATMWAMHGSTRPRVRYCAAFDHTLPELAMQFQTSSCNYLGILIAASCLITPSGHPPHVIAAMEDCTTTERS
jgi:hypothetical protein